MQVWDRVVVEAPENVLSGIARDAEVQRIWEGEVGVPYVLAGAVNPVLGDGITDEDDVCIAIFKPSELCGTKAEQVQIVDVAGDPRNCGSGSEIWQTRLGNGSTRRWCHNPSGGCLYDWPGGWGRLE